MTTHDYMKGKLFSGRFLWCLSGAVVFGVGSLTGVIPVDDVKAVLVMIATFYFTINRNGSK